MLVACGRQMTRATKAGLMLVRDDGFVRALVMPLEQEMMMRGIVVMYHDGDDLVLVNVIGKFRPETIATATDGLGIEMPQMHIEMPEMGAHAK